MRIAMRWTWMQMIGAGAVVAGTLAVATQAGAEERALYRWETADGTIAFTDDAKRVPERYRDAAETVERTMLGDYGRYTATDAAANDEYARRLDERLDSLRALNEASEETARAAARIERERMAAPALRPARREIQRRRLIERADGTKYYRHWSEPTEPLGAGASLPVDPNDPSPVVTEQRRVKVPGQPFTQTVTVTRQGDRVLSVVQPLSNYNELDFPELSEFTE